MKFHDVEQAAAHIHTYIHTYIGVGAEQQSFFVGSHSSVEGTTADRYRTQEHRPPSTLRDAAETRVEFPLFSPWKTPAYNNSFFAGGDVYVVSYVRYYLLRM